MAEGTFSELLRYELGSGVEAFSTRRDSVLPYSVITGHQVHGAKVAKVDRPDLIREDLEGFDAFMTDLKGVAIGVRTADCAPILLYDPVARAVAAVHSGWRGTLQQVSQKAIFAMKRHFGSEPANLRAVIGPCLGMDSFQVGAEVVIMFKEQGFPLDDIWIFREGYRPGKMEGGHHIDLVKSNRWLLEEAGVIPGNIQSDDIDTYTDESFFSARREGYKCGRTINGIMLL